MTETAENPDVRLARRIGKFYADPLGFIMFAFPWDTDPAIQLVELVEPWKSRYPNFRYGPDKWACEFLDGLGEDVRSRAFNGKDAVSPIQYAVASGHGIGKSTMSAWLILWISSTRPFSKGTVTANTSEQLKTKTWAELGKWHKRCITGHWFDYSNTRGNMSLSHIDHKTEWRCDAQTCREENSEAFAGQHAANSTSYYINDESSAVPDIIWQVQEGGLTDGEPMRFAFGNPTRNTGSFRECFRKFKHRWKQRHIDSREVAITNKVQIQEWIDDYGEDSDFAKIRVRGMFPAQSSTQFISEAAVDAAYGKHLRDEQYKFAPIVISCDPAWEGDDELVIALRQGLMFKVLRVLQKNDNDVEIATIIANYEDEEQADMVNIDAGYGTGIVSAGQTMGRSWNLVWFSGESPEPGYINMRAYMWGQMKKWLSSGGALPKDQTLYYDLTGPETVPRLDGKIQLESKKDMKKRKIPSPNRADALALTFAFPVAKRMRGGLTTREQSDYNPLRSVGNRVNHDYNPLG